MSQNTQDEFTLLNTRIIAYYVAQASEKFKNGLKPTDIFILPSERPAVDRLKKIQMERTVRELKKKFPQ